MGLLYLGIGHLVSLALVSVKAGEDQMSVATFCYVPWGNDAPFDWL